MEIVNAYLDGSAVVMLLRSEAGLVQHRERAEYSFFVWEKDIDADLLGMLRSSKAVRGITKEKGGYLRIMWRDEWARRDMINGRKDEHGTRHPSPFQVREIPIFEGDVDPVRRCLTDKQVTIASPRRFYFDFETDSRVPPREAALGKARILSIALASEDESQQWLGVITDATDEAERALLRAFHEKLAEFRVEQVLAWNGDRFDFTAWQGRISKLAMVFEMRNLLLLDHLVMFKRMNLGASDSGDEKQSMSLNAVAQSQLGEGKEEIPPEVAARWPGRSLGSLSWELWEAGGEFRELLGRYNMKDTLLLARIERKTGYAALFDTLCDVCKVLPNSKGLLPTRQMDGFMFGLGVDRGFRFTTKTYADDEAEQEQYKGAFVMEPSHTGILKNVHVADFASLYPSVIITWNMSPETKMSGEAVRAMSGPSAGYCSSPLTGTCFSTSAEGMLPAALKTMLALRKEWSEKQASLPPGTPEAKEAGRRSGAYKIAANSFYGVIGSTFARYYDREVAESVTQNAVWLIKQTIAEAEKRKMTVFYGDTDSFFAFGVTQLGFGDFVDWCNTSLYPKELSRLGCRENRVKLAYEKAFSTIVMVGKKRYAGKFDHYKGSKALPVPAEGEAFDKKKHSRPEIKGLEYKRGDASVLARRLQERVIMQLMRDDIAPVKYRGFLTEALAHVAQDDLPLEEIQITKSLSKPIKDYERMSAGGKEVTLPAHVRVAKDMLAAGKEIGEGARVSYVIVDGSDGIEAIPAQDYTGELDRYYLWENTVYPPTQRVLQAAFPNENWVEGLKRIRPPKKRGAHQAQGSLFGSSHGMIADQERLVIEEAQVSRDDVAAIAQRLRGAPGTRKLTVVLKLRSGAEAVVAAGILTTREAVHAEREALRHPKVHEAVDLTAKVMEESMIKALEDTAWLG